jgi:hypothetical protein
MTEVQDWNNIGESASSNMQTKARTEVNPGAEIKPYIGQKVKISNGIFTVVAQSGDYVDIIDEAGAAMQIPLGELLESATIISETIN